MPGIIVRNGQFRESGSGIDGKEIWSKQRDDVSREQLQKFWSELSPAMRRELLRIDKQTLFEQARKNLYCSRCNGLLLEGFSQIIMYAKSVQQENGGSNSICELTNQRLEPDDCEEDGHDPSLHPWGGLVATREGLLTLMDCFLEGTSLDGVQSVFDSARAREHDREMLYPDACGGSGRGWISQGIFSYGRGHGMRETCALHTAKLSCDALVDFWSALGDDTRLSLLRMKEEDFIERLMYRFDSKRFCRDCRRNVIREFKELKELKRMKKELRCTTWFCGADTAFQYEVSDATIHVDWCHSFDEVVDTYHHFEWAVGTGEGKSDILAFEDVGMNGSAEVDGLELGGLGACFITLRAWRLDGRCTELTGKAHAMKGQPCVHRRLVVGDGFVTICSGDNIRKFFEHAEEAEEEEDDDSMDKDGSEIDGESSRPQKHAKSPELAREFLLDAATVIFKEQVEKAFREGTARQNAHSIFVCLTLKLLEERVLVACKEIITLEKQKKLLEEEEKEKHEEELRKERRRLKEREKKLRRKERIRGKEKETNKSSIDQNETVPLEAFEDSSTTDVQDDSQHYYNLLSPVWKEDVVEEVSHTSTDLSHVITKSSLPTSDVQCIEFEQQNFDTDAFDSSYENIEEYNDAFTMEQSKSSRRKVKLRKDAFSDSASQWSGKHEPTVENENHDCRRIPDARFHGLRGPSSRCPVGPRQSRWRTNNRSYASKLNCSCNKMDDRYSTGACFCNQYNTYRMKGNQSSADMRTSRGIKTFKQPDNIMDMSKPYYRETKYSNGTFSSDGYAVSKWPKVFPVDHYGGRADISHTKRIWAPMDARKRFSKGNSHLDDACPVYDDLKHGDMDARERNDNKEQPDSSKEPSANSPESDTRDGNVCDDKRQASKTNVDLCCPDTTLSSRNISDRLSGSCSYSSSPCPSEADSSSPRNTDSLSASDSEDASPSEEREAGEYNSSTNSHDSPGTDRKVKTDTLLETEGRCAAVNSLESNSSTAEAAATINGNTDDVKYTAKFLHSASNQAFPVHAYPSHAPRCYPTTASWVASAANNGLSPFPQPADHFIIPNYPIGYTAQAHVSSPFYVPYGTLQPLSPLYSAASIPYLYPIKSNRSSNLKLKERLSTAKLKSNWDGKASEVPERPIGPLKNIPSEASSVSKNGEVAADMDRSSFSFFHFGVPACSSLKEDGERVDLHSPVWPIASDQAKVDATRCKKEAGVEEEYSLFSASNRNRFAFF